MAAAPATRSTSPASSSRRLNYDRAPLPAIALTTDTSVLTAIGNDYGYEHVFERQVLGLGRQGDVLLAISTSGRSPNVLRAIEAAREQGDGGDRASPGASGDDGRAVRSAACARRRRRRRLIQQLHIAAAHIVCALVERAIFPQSGMTTAWLPSARPPCWWAVSAPTWRADRRDAEAAATLAAIGLPGLAAARAVPLRGGGGAAADRASGPTRWSGLARIAAPPCLSPCAISVLPRSTAAPAPAARCYHAREHLAERFLLLQRRFLSLDFNLRRLLADAAGTPPEDASGALPLRRVATAATLRRW